MEQLDQETCLGAVQFQIEIGCHYTEYKKGDPRYMKPQVDPSHYLQREYDSKKRFISYWHQVHEILLLEPETVLEVGIGSGLVTHYLRRRGVNVTTLDIDGRLSPDYVGSITDIPFAGNTFDVIACYEVLEHIPYSKVAKALREIHRVSNRYAILSLPDCARAYRFEIQIPKLGDLKKLIPLPRLRPPKHEFDGEHHWEIGKARYPLQRIIRDIEGSGFKVTKSYRPFEMPGHRFFVLEKL